MLRSTAFTRESPDGTRFRVPDDEPRSIQQGPDPDRVLLVGSSPVAGIGVTSHQHALTGSVARQLAKHSGRGVIVEAVGRIGARLHDIPDLLSSTQPHRFDAVVITAGMLEAIDRTPTATWARDLDRVIEVLRQKKARDGCLIVTGIPTPTSTGGVHGRLGRQSDRHAALLNRTSVAAVAGRHYGHFAQLGPSPHENGQPNRAGYAIWATQICAILEPVLTRTWKESRTTHAPFSGPTPPFRPNSSVPW